MSLEQFSSDYGGLLKRGDVDINIDDLHPIDIISHVSKRRLTSQYLLESTSVEINGLFNGGLLSNQLVLYETDDPYHSERIVASFIANALTCHPLSNVIYLTTKCYYPKLVISNLPPDIDYKQTLSRLKIMPVYEIANFIASINYLKSSDCEISLIVINSLNLVLNKSINREFKSIIMHTLKILPFQLGCCLLAITHPVTAEARFTNVL